MAGPPPGKSPACWDWVELRWRGRVRGKGLLVAQGTGFCCSVQAGFCCTAGAPHIVRATERDLGGHGASLGDLHGAPNWKGHTCYPLAI